MPDETPPAGESPSLEERLREYADSKTTLEDVPGEPDGIEICGWCGQTWPEHDPAGCIAQTVADALAELTRLTADVERLTAANDAGNTHLPSARADLEDAIRDKDAAKARAERYREALYDIACRPQVWTRAEMINRAARALTEGAQNAD
jgi:hypothetical protein